MSTFTQPLIVCPLRDGKTWALVSEFYFDVGSVNSGDRITVDVGFLTDFASVPGPFRLFIPRWGKYGNAAVIHDWLYWTQPKDRTRKEIDLIFLDGMKCLEVPKIKRWIIYMGVRLGGLPAWNKNYWERVSGYTRTIQAPELSQTVITKTSHVPRPSFLQAYKDSRQPNLKTETDNQ